MAARTNMQRLESLVATLPEAVRVNVEHWDDSPTFRVRGKNFVFCNEAVTYLMIKLSKEEAEAVIATDDHVFEGGYGLGRHGWVNVLLPTRVTKARWEEVTEWILTSYTLVAPKTLARTVMERVGLEDTEP